MGDDVFQLLLLCDILLKDFVFGEASSFDLTDLTQWLANGSIFSLPKYLPLCDLRCQVAPDASEE